MKHSKIRKMLVVLVLEVLFLSCFVGICIRDYKSNSYKETILGEQLHELSNYGLDYGYYIDTSYGPGGQVKIGIENIILKKGTYAIDIKYQCCGYPRFLMEYKHQRNEYNISGTNVLLEDIASEKRVIVNIMEEAPAQMVFRLSTEAKAGDYLLIDSIRITSTFQGYLTKIFYIFIFVAIVNIGIYLWLNRKNINISKENRMVLACLLVISFVPSIPLFTSYITDAHDLSFHLARIEGLKNNLYNGVFPSRIQPQWLNNHGYPVSVFYGDLFLYVPALLRVVGVSLQNAYKFYIVCINFITAWSGYICFSRITKSKKSGIVGAAIYSLNVYRLTNIYVRGAVGEYTAMVFFPIVLYGLWFVLIQEREELEKNKNIWILLAIGYLGVLNSHLISCVMIGLFTIFVIIVYIKRVLTKERFWLLFKAFIGLVLGGLWFIVPLVQYMSMDFVSNSGRDFVRFRQEERGIFWAQFFNTSYDVTAETKSVINGMSGEMPLTLGNTFLFIVIVLVVIGIYDYKIVKDRKELILAIFLCVLFMWMCTHTFPFSKLAQTSELLTMLITNIQYPWRFLAIVALCGAWIGALLISENVCDKINEKYCFLSISILIVFIINDSSQLMGQVMQEGGTRRIYEEASLISTWVSGGEYLYKNAIISDYQNDISNIEDGIEIVSWERENGKLYLNVNNHTLQEKTLEVPLIYYYGYEAREIETNEKMLMDTGQSHRIKLRIPANYQGEICISFREPLSWRIAEIVSICTSVWFGICIVRNRKKNKMDDFGKEAIDLFN